MPRAHVWFSTAAVVVVEEMMAAVGEWVGQGLTGSTRLVIYHSGFKERQTSVHNPTHTGRDVASGLGLPLVRAVALPSLLSFHLLCANVDPWEK